MGILSGYKRFKKYLRTGEGYKLCSEWTKSDSVEMTDGSTLQETMDNIASDVENAQNNITDVHNELMTSLGGMTFGVDAAGRYGYIKAGADTVTPFKSHANVIHFNPIWNSTNTSSVSISNGTVNGTFTVRAKSVESYDFLEGCIGIAFSIKVNTEGATYANHVTLTFNNKTVSAPAVFSQIGTQPYYIFYLNETTRPGAGDGHIYIELPSLHHTNGYPEDRGNVIIDNFYVIT